VVVVVPVAALPVLAALVLAFIVANLVFLAVESAAAELRVHDEYDDLLVVREEREALRLLRVRYARGEVSFQVYRQLCSELQGAQPG